MRGESTPFYLMDKNSHRRLRDLVPYARIIALLRDPVDRPDRRRGQSVEARPTGQVTPVPPRPQ